MSKSRARRRRRNMFVAADRMRRRRRRNANLALKRAKAFVFRESLRDPITREYPDVLVAPRFFTLWHKEARTELLRFLKDIQNAVEYRERQVFIDFSETFKMVADGTLLFHAILHRLTSAIGPRKMIQCSYPKNAIVEQVLMHLGIFKMLGKPNRSAVDHKTVKHWCYATSTTVDGSKAAFLDDYEGKVTASFKTSNIYRGITEAMANSREHAYPKGDGDELFDLSEDPRWWMFSQELDGVLSVAFCDLGIGIPQSLRTNAKWEQLIKQYLGRSVRVYDLKGILSSDAAMIKTALEIGKSQTREDHRGKGLQEIKNVLEKQGQGKMFILSGSGGYFYEPAKSSEKSRSYADKMPGTLITWIIPLGNETNNG
jgi:hypothetical protein